MDKIMEIETQPPKFVMTREEGLSAGKEIIRLIEEVSAPYTYKEPGAVDQLPPDFGFKLWYLIPVLLAAIFGVKTLGPEFDLASITKWVGPMLVLGFIMGIGLLTIVAGVFLTGKIFRFISGKRNTEIKVHNKVISDADLKRLSENIFIKAWLLEALNKHDTLTYALIYKERYRISHNVTVGIVVAEKKRIRTLING